MNVPLRDELQTTLGNTYTIERELGGGGMSRVYLAVERRFERRVVIKVLSPELAEGLSSDRFEREIGLAAGLQQANIVPVITAGDVGGLPWYSMPFIDGESLRVRMQKGAVPAAEAIAILKDVARALAYAHERGIVHRDIKPENILLSGDAAVVTDFGIAKAVSASKTNAPGGTLTQVGTSLGTPAYMAPEQAVGSDVDGRADIYAWGVIAYELLAGRHPFADKTTAQQLVAAHIAELPAPLTPSTATTRLVMRALAKNPPDRPGSAKELIDALNNGATDPVRASASPRNRTPVIVAIGLAVAVLAAVTIMFVTTTRSTEQPASGVIGTLAVLPFVNTGGDARDEYFSDGMTDELAHALSELPGLRLAGRTSSYSFKGKPVDAREIGRVLDVEGIVEGTVRRSGDRLRVTAALISTADGKQRWSDSYESIAKDVFAVQDELTRAIVAALAPALGEKSAASLAEASRGTRDAEAYDAYLRGRHFWSQRGTRNLLQAIDEYRRAIARDSNFARAYGGLAMTYVILPGYISDPADTLTPMAVAAAQRALMLDSTLIDAKLALSTVKSANLEFDGAERLFEEILRREPSNATARQWHGNNLSRMGQFDLAIAELRKATNLDPLSSVIYTNLSYAYGPAGKADSGLLVLRRALPLDRNIVDPPLMSLYIFGGQVDSALVHLARMRRDNPSAPVTTGMFAFALAAGGRWSQFDSVRAEARGAPQSNQLLDAAIIALAAGEREPMVRYLLTPAGRRHWAAVFIAGHCAPILAPLRGDTRVADFVGTTCPPVTWPIQPRP